MRERIIGKLYAYQKQLIIVLLTRIIDNIFIYVKTYMIMQNYINLLI